MYLPKFYVLFSQSKFCVIISNLKRKSKNKNPTTAEITRSFAANYLIPEYQNCCQPSYIFVEVVVYRSCQLLRNKECLCELVYPQLVLMTSLQCNCHQYTMFTHTSFHVCYVCAFVNLILNLRGRKGCGSEIFIRSTAPHSILTNNK